MELTKFQIANIKRVNKSVSMLEKQRSKIQAKVDEFNKELESLVAQIELWETPIRPLTGGLTSTEFLQTLIDKVDKDIEELSEPNEQTE